MALTRTLNGRWVTSFVAVTAHHVPLHAVLRDLRGPQALALLGAMAFAVLLGLLLFAAVPHGWEVFP